MPGGSYGPPQCSIFSLGAGVQLIPLEQGKCHDGGGLKKLPAPTGIKASPLSIVLATAVSHDPYTSWDT